MTVAATATRKKASSTGVGDKNKKAADSGALLAWYDRHRRTLPWRAQKGERADPYCVWLSEIMLQQTTVRAVAPYYARFLARWPEVRALAAAPLDDVLKAWAGLGYYARARNLHACARAVVERHGGAFPGERGRIARTARHRRLHGGRHCGDRVRPARKPGRRQYRARRRSAFRRRGAAAVRKAEAAAACRTITPQKRAGDFAQAMMDLGATICSPKRPACALCPWNDNCAAFARGDAETFPRRTPKREGALRRGAAFVVRRADGCLLVRTRPAKGLLGGMTEVPTTAWSADFDESEAVDSAPVFSPRPGGERVIEWRRMPGVVRHVFTHFPLELSVYAAELPPRLLHRTARAGRGFQSLAAKRCQASCAKWSHMHSTSSPHERKRYAERNLRKEQFD